MKPHDKDQPNSDPQSGEPDIAALRDALFVKLEPGKDHVYKILHSDDQAVESEITIEANADGFRNLAYLFLAVSEGGASQTDLINERLWASAHPETRFFIGELNRTDDDFSTEQHDDDTISNACGIGCILIAILIPVLTIIGVSTVITWILEMIN